MASTFQLLEKAEELELLAERLYQALAARFDGDARALFLQLAGEEAQHAARVRLLAVRSRHDRRLVSALAGDSRFIDALLAEAGQSIVEVQAGGWDGDARAAVARAASLERRFCSAHAQMLSADAHPELRRFFDQLAEQDRGHAELLAP